MSKAAGGVRKVVDMFDGQALIKAKSSAHSHRSTSEDEKKVSNDLRKLKPFSPVLNRCHNSFVGIPSDPLEDLDEESFSKWLTRHQRNIALHFPAVESTPVAVVDPIEENDEDGDDFNDLMCSLALDNN